MATDKPRTQRVNVRLSQGIVDRLEAEAERMGLAPSTLASYAVADYLNSRETQRKNAVSANAMIARQTGAALETVLSDPDQLKAIASLFGQSGEEQLALLEGEK